FNLREEFFAFARFAGGDGYVHDDAAFIFDSGVLFVRRLEVVLLARGRHRRIGIGWAVLFGLVSAALRRPAARRPWLFLIPRVLAALAFFPVHFNNLIHMPRRQAVPPYIRANERGVDVHRLRVDKTGFCALADNTDEYAPEQLSAPALPNSRETASVRQFLV